jgi:hypothetical protein
MVILERNFSACRQPNKNIFYEKITRHGFYRVLIFYFILYLRGVRGISDLEGGFAPA